MDTVLEGETQVDRCRNCRGLYFEQLTQLLLAPLSKFVPIIDPEHEAGNGPDGDGAEIAYDDMVYVECPKCDGIMDQRLIEAPRRIRFELCPTCNATFLDAGELREYTSPEFLDDFKSLLPER